MTRLLFYILWASLLPSAVLAEDQILLGQVNDKTSRVRLTLPAEPVKASSAPGLADGSNSTAAIGAEVIGLEDAIRHALASSPRLKAVRAAEAGSRGERRQAGALPNPVAGFSKQNIMATGAYKVISPGQSVYEINQLIEVGGKLSARKDIADKGVQIAGLEYQAAALDVIRDVTIAYADAVAAEENVRIASEQKALARDVLKAVSARVDAAASPRIQKSRADVERASSSVALDSAERVRAISFRVLAALLGEDESTIKLDETEFFKLAARNMPVEMDGLEGNPDLAKLDVSLEQSRARLALEKANAIPDPTLNAGLVRIPSADGSALVVGVALPIPVLNVNRGNIEKARNEVKQTEEENRFTALSLNTELTRAQEEMENAYVLATALSGEIIPAAQEAFSLAREGYGLGRFPYIEVLDAQRSLFGARQQYIAALNSYHRSRAILDRLSAHHRARVEGLEVADD